MERKASSEIGFIMNETEERMVKWMVFSYVEKAGSNHFAQMSVDLSIPEKFIRESFKDLEESRERSWIKSVTLAVQWMVQNNKFPIDRLDTQSIPKLSGRAKTLVECFDEGLMDSEICDQKHFNMPLDELNQLKAKVFKKYNTKNRFYVVAVGEKKRLLDIK